ncbi:hypothetical protein WH279_15360 [Erwinia sp. MYb375]
MKSSLKATLFIIVVIAGVFFYCWPTIKIELAGSAHYTEQDKREYEF